MAIGTLAIVGSAWAYFSSPGSGTASASVGTLPAPTHVTGAPSGTIVAVSWTGVSDPGSGSFGYVVTRMPYPSGTTVDACGSSPTSLLPATVTSCSDTSVPNGTYIYTVTAVYNSFSAGESSSQVNVAVAPTASAPVVSATTTFGSSPIWLNKENITLTDDALTNGGPSVASVSYYYCPQSVAPCTSSNWTPIGTSSSTGTWPFTLASAMLPADGTYDVVATATNTTSLTSPVSSATEVGVDTTAPVTTDNTASIGNAWKNTSQTVTLSAVDIGSGIEQTYYTTDGSTPSESGGVPVGTTKAGASILLNTSGQYAIKYFSVDNTGNVEAVKTAGTVIRIDVIGPTVPVPTVNGH